MARRQLEHGERALPQTTQWYERRLALQGITVEPDSYQMGRIQVALELVSIMRTVGLASDVLLTTRYEEVVSFLQTFLIEQDLWDGLIELYHQLLTDYDAFYDESLGGLASFAGGLGDGSPPPPGSPSWPDRGQSSSSSEAS